MPSKHFIVYMLCSSQSLGKWVEPRISQHIKGEAINVCMQYNVHLSVLPYSNCNDIIMSGLLSSKVI